MSETIRTEFLGCDIETLRAFMLGIMERVFGDDEWEPTTGEKVGAPVPGYLAMDEVRYEHTLPTEAYWDVYRVKDTRGGDRAQHLHEVSACIIARAQPDGGIRVDFIDGYSTVNRELLANPVGQAFVELAEYITQQATNATTAQAGKSSVGDTKPEKPPTDAPHDTWFRWYHEITDELGYKMTLKELASEMGLSYNYVRQLHSEYIAEHHNKRTNI